MTDQKITLKPTLRSRVSKRFLQWGKGMEVLVRDPDKQRVLASRIKQLGLTLARFVILFGLSFVIVYPIIQQVAIAFRAPEDINNVAVVWIPETLSIENFRIAMAALDYWTAFQNTVFLAFFATLLQVASTSLVGYAFARFKFPGHNLLFILVLLTIIVPPATLAFPQFLYFRRAGLLGQPGAIFLMSGLGMGINSGIFIYLFRQFFKGIPLELEEAAQVDGASAFKIFYTVMLPNARGAIVTVALFAFVWQWNDSYFSGMFISGANVDFPILAHRLTTLVHGLQGTLTTLGIWRLVGQDVTENPLFVSLILNTAGIMVMAPLLIMYLFVQRLFVEGIERTGITG
ncbi:MAG: carbohydrate ABC transporter permease [Acholeplasmatales bacterium]|nr:MAG: carbohydrate ABC transporter permease [Acholeplasmatales bacterium]